MTELTLNDMHSARPSGVLAALPMGTMVSLAVGTRCWASGVDGNFWVDFNSTVLWRGMRGVFIGTAGVEMLAAYSELTMAAIFLADAGELTESNSAWSPTPPCPGVLVPAPACEVWATAVVRRAAGVAMVAMGGGRSGGWIL